ncbi:FecR family protein [Arcobacter cryaerophilus gv. pseudocryaerophilus]|uniref:FecR family protein n=3 Tax=unclassified Arcobacter TaxID=2593671 RepID=A0AA96IE89_9BACT|nr:FecR family protein [Arcobacter sp. AZ-2023]WPD04989.1 FecR family protein [Arcobacter sp. DSM 115956]WPD07084.1 FecR family protein [Arcobacter sp. DSM 115955]WNL31349.1 FecR family protein [Arcobacter sp. AZ-2023]WNP37499.1 FecR family protein [Arcobacter sp. AZ-2023]
MKKIILMFLIFVSTLFANIGKITLLEGEAFVKRGEETLRLNISDSISNNDFIETKTNSKVKITFIDNTIITIGKESSLKIEDYFFDSNNKNSAKSELNVSKGAFHAITGQIGKVNPEKFKLKTKNATIGIRGTEIYGDQNRVFCTQGAIFVLSFGETREVSQGFFVNTFDNQIPSQSTPIDQQQFQDVNSNLNNNNLGNNQNSNSFDNPSSPLAFQNSQSPEMNQNQDNQNSWGYWADHIQNENNISKIDQDIAKIDEDIAKKSEESNSGLQLTDANYIKEQINSSQFQLLSFYGSFSGDKVTNSGHINLNFNIGSGNNDITGEYSFGYEMIQHYGSFANGNIYEDPRNGQMYFETMSYSDARAEGQFYGSTMNSISGTLNNFDINNPDASVNFSANR